MGSFTRFDVFEAELIKLIEDEMDRVKEETSLGLLKTYEEYKSATGKIQGLRAALDMIDQARSITNQKLGA
jgi:hypothetical protein